MHWRSCTRKCGVGGVRGSRYNYDRMMFLKRMKGRLRSLFRYHPRVTSAVLGVLFWNVLGVMALGLGVGDTWLDWRSRARPKP